MNGDTSNDETEFVEYNDENIEHVLSGPDYGQPGSSSFGWDEKDSWEYPDFVSEIRTKILKNKARINPEKF